MATLSTTAPATAADTQADAALRILRRLLHNFMGGIALRLWNNRTYQLGQGAPAFTLVLHDPKLLKTLVQAGSPLLLADAYFRGQIDIEGDLYSALSLKGHFEGLAMPWHDKLRLLWDASLPKTRSHSTLLARLEQRFSGSHTRQTDRQAIAFHYDVSNAFYALWLDTERVYSCAYFNTPQDTLDEAQRNKLDHVCRKLRLQPGERLLDIGCGWGALVCRAARHYGVHAHGITLSQEQYNHAQLRIWQEGLQDLVTVELRDYRDLQGEAVYDKVASIGMLEHVGLSNMPRYLGCVMRVLRPNGLFLNHGITHDEEGWNQTLATEFINRYVFPDGEFDCISNIQLGMERAGFEIEDVEALRRHYALTLRHWVQRLEAQREAALQEVDEPTWRVWHLYMAACALEFEAGGTGVYQILASKRGVDTPLPLTRQDVYAPHRQANWSPVGEL